LLAEPLTLNDLMITRAMAEIRETVAREKQRRGELGFDDMLSRLDAALRSENGEALAAAIRARFPVAMIDEFQDTDPQQYRIFRRISAAGHGAAADWRSETGYLCLPRRGYFYLHESP
jgi:exodeoxyribonuclease V beta subunit